MPIAPTPTAERVQIRRAELGLTHAALSRRAGVTPARLRRFVYYGERLSPAELDRIASVLGLDPAELRAGVAA